MEIKLKIKSLSLENKPGKDLILNEKIFGLLPREDIITRVVRWQLSKRRLGNHSVKTRSDIKMTTAKMYKQKGTGKARHGSGAVSQFRGGGMAHGPVVHSHSHRLNKKVKKLGIKSALSDKFKLGKLVILDSLKCDGKTSSLKKNFDKLGVDNALIISGEKIDANFIKASSNIKNLDILSYQGLNVYDIIKKDNLIIVDDALKLIEERLS
ncbi:50S ribosomal protein L4 [Alphaproteobacteria bacterium]|nr:50S ribosomal protein L4 [Alphaproteobacteria bacterium]